MANGLGSRDISATWQSSCVFNSVPTDGINSQGDDVAQILSFTIHQIGQDPVLEESGFTISFKQLRQPEILRLSPFPVAITYDEKFTESWRDPTPEDRIPVTEAQRIDSKKEGLEEAIRELKELKAQERELRRLIKDKKHKIRKLLKQGYREFKSDLRQCGGVKCVVNTVFSKVPDVVHLIQAHIRPLPPHPPGLFSACRHGHHHSTSPEKDTTITPENVDKLPPEIHRDNPPLDLPPLPDDNEDHSSPVFHHNGNTPPPFPPPHNGDFPPPLPPYRHHAPPPPPLHHHAGHTFFRTFHIVKLCAIIIGLTTFFALLFCTLRRSTTSLSLCCSPRRHADRLARREERRNARAYRRAARHHRWSQWWNRYRMPRSNNDYEEKRALILQQEGILEDAMQAELRELQGACEVVSDIVRAEEGRNRHYNPAQHPSQQHASPAELDAGASGLMRRSNSLPGYESRSEGGYSTEPPGYDEELGEELAVVDGFMYAPLQYTPSASEDTPGSSVVDCSPRLSEETRETAEGDGDGGGKE